MIYKIIYNAAEIENFQKKTIIIWQSDIKFFDLFNIKKFKEILLQKNFDYNAISIHQLVLLWLHIFKLKFSDIFFILTYFIGCSVFVDWSNILYIGIYFFLGTILIIETKKNIDSMSFKENVSIYAEQNKQNKNLEEQQKLNKDNLKND